MMKRTLIGWAMVGAMAGTAVAQDAVPPAEKAQTLVNIARRQVGERKIEKATYLGIASSPVSAALREQLNLKKGVGLVVERVEKDSPAEQAGVKQYDIVEKMDDQLLMNSDQFASLVRMQEPGATVKLSIIRQGQTQTVTATLVEKETSVATVTATRLLGDLNGNIRVSSPATSIKIAPGPVDSTTRSPKEMTITSAIGENIITLKRDGDNTHLTANDVNGNHIFDGDVNTEADWANVPPDVAKEARRLMGMVGKSITIPRVNSDQWMIGRDFQIAVPKAVAAPAAPAAPAEPVQVDVPIQP